MAKSKGVVLVTPKFRVSFPKIFKPEFNKLSKKDEYSIVALFAPGQDIKELRDAAKKVASDVWGPDPKMWPKNWKNPFKDQGDRETAVDTAEGKKLVLPDGYVKGAIMIQMKSKNKPGVIDQQKKPIEVAEEFYAGCYARAQVFVSVYEIPGEAGNIISRGVSVSLNHLQKVAEGDPFSARRKAEDCFEAVDGPAEGTTEDGGDENPFG